MDSGPPGMPGYTVLVFGAEDSFFKEIPALDGELCPTEVNLGFGGGGGRDRGAPKCKPLLYFSPLVSEEARECVTIQPLAIQPLAIRNVWRLHDLVPCRQTEKRDDYCLTIDQQR